MPVDNSKVPLYTYETARDDERMEGGRMGEYLSRIWSAMLRHKLFYSLKGRMTTVFLLSSFMTFVLVSSASYYTIYSILYNKLEKNVQLTVDQTTRELDQVM